jgi:hypothetical protein
MEVIDLFRIFPDFPIIKLDSQVNMIELQHYWSNLTNDEIKEKIDEYIGLRIIQPFKNGEYRITQAGWNLWSKEQAKAE